jgi:peroxiredoxin/uncharacterized protein YqgQ
MKKAILLVLSFIISFTSLAQTTISGMVSGGEGQVVRLIAFDDFISEKIITLGKSNIDEDGNFSMAFELDETICAWLDINYQRSEIFLEPGKSYSVTIDYNSSNQLESYFDRQSLVYEFNQPDSGDLNMIIWQFNAMYNKFVMENFQQIVTRHDKSRIVKFRDEVDEKFSNIKNIYFNNYVIYKLADVEQFGRIKGKNLLAEEYFSDKPVLYNNVEYTFFFMQFFEKFLITNPDVITISDLIILVNDMQDNQALLDSLGRLPYLQDMNLRELVMLNGLKDLYHNGIFEKDKVLMMIKTFSLMTKDPKQKQIAINLLKTLGRLTPGVPAPDLLLTGSNGESFRLRDIKGKPIYLYFYRSGQKGTHQSFDMLAETYSLYQAGLEVICVSMDIDASGLKLFTDSGKYRWTFAHYGNVPEVYDLYNIRDLPLYVLIDVEGNIAMYPAPSPGEDLESALIKVMH